MMLTALILSLALSRSGVIASGPGLVGVVPLRPDREPIVITDNRKVWGSAESGQACNAFPVLCRFGDYYYIGCYEAAGHMATTWSGRVIRSAIDDTTNWATCFVLQDWVHGTTNVMPAKLLVRGNELLLFGTVRPNNDIALLRTLLWSTSDGETWTQQLSTPTPQGTIWDTVQTNGLVYAILHTKGATLEYADLWTLDGTNFSRLCVAATNGAAETAMWFEGDTMWGWSRMSRVPFSDISSNLLFYANAPYTAWNTLGLYSGATAGSRAINTGSTRYGVLAVTRTMLLWGPQFCTGIYRMHTNGFRFPLGLANATYGDGGYGDFVYSDDGLVGAYYSSGADTTGPDVTNATSIYFMRFE